MNALLPGRLYELYGLTEGFLTIIDRVGARYQRVSEVVILEDFPRSAAGKVLKRALREPYWTEAGRKI